MMRPCVKPNGCMYAEGVHSSFAGWSWVPGFAAKPLLMLRQLLFPTTVWPLCGQPEEASKCKCPLRWLTSLASAARLPSPCLLLGTLQATLPSPCRPLACRVSWGRACPLLHIVLLSLTTEAVQNILQSWEMSSLPLPVCFSALSDSCGSWKCSALCRRISYLCTWVIQLECPLRSPPVAQEDSTCFGLDSVQEQSQIPMCSVC